MQVATEAQFDAFASRLRARKKGHIVDILTGHGGTFEDENGVKLRVPPSRVRGGEVLVVRSAAGGGGVLIDGKWKPTNEGDEIDTMMRAVNTAGRALAVAIAGEEAIAAAEKQASGRSLASKVFGEDVVRRRELEEEAFQRAQRREDAKPEDNGAGLASKIFGGDR